MVGSARSCYLPGVLMFISDLSAYKNRDIFKEEHQHPLRANGVTKAEGKRMSEWVMRVAWMKRIWNDLCLIALCKMQHISSTWGGFLSLGLADLFLGILSFLEKVVKMGREQGCRGREITSPSSIDGSNLLTCPGASVVWTLHQLLFRAEEYN